jgi:hypothetical protein
VLVISLAHMKPEQHAVPEPGVQGVPPPAHMPQVPPLQCNPIAQSASVMHVPPIDAAVQTPDRHVSAPQQSSEPTHRPPAMLHAQCPPVQAAPLQHSDDDAQVPPEAMQHVPDTPPVEERQVSEPQQGEPLAEQLMPALTHMLIELQMPMLHVSPVMQSAEVVHGPPDDDVEQRPERQVSEPQQSPSLVHAPVDARQQRVSPWATAHELPAAHMVMPGVHGPPTGIVPVPLEHVLPVQVSPEQQSALVVQLVPEV